MNPCRDVLHNPRFESAFYLASSIQALMVGDEAVQKTKRRASAVVPKDEAIECAPLVRSGCN